MKFETLTVQSVKSISQRSLLWYWNELAAGRRFPRLRDFHLDSRMHDPKGLMVWDVERSDGSRKFRLREQGARLVEAFHGNWVGKTMDVVMPKAIRTYALDTANECAASGCTVFSILATEDAAGHRVDCERLLLPFGDGANVEQVVASLQLISLNGTFERRTILNSYRMTSRVELAGRIASGFARPVIRTPGMVIDLRDGNLQAAGLATPH